MYVDYNKYKKQLAKKGLKVGYLINQTGVSREMYYKYIKGKNEAPNDFILRLANELVCPVIYLKK